MTEYVAMVLGFIAGWIACATVSRTETASRRLQNEGGAGARNDPCGVDPQRSDSQQELVAAGYSGAAATGAGRWSVVRGSSPRGAWGVVGTPPASSKKESRHLKAWRQSVARFNNNGASIMADNLNLSKEGAPLRGKHTPGPWVLSYSVSGYPYQVDAPNGSDGPGGIKSVTRWAAFCMPSSDEGRANAHLIAAAPDLLEALKAFVAWTDKHHLPGDVIDIEVAAYEAIAKAEGAA